MWDFVQRGRNKLKDGDIHSNLILFFLDIKLDLTLKNKWHERTSPIIAKIV